MATTMTTRGSILHVHNVLRSILFLLLFSEFHDSVVATSKLSKLPPLFAMRHSLHLLMMPPAARLALGQANGLKGDCQKQTNGMFYWEPELTNCDYRLATKLFEFVFAQTGNDVTLWLPRLDSDTKKLHSLV